jgi:hypothetical protein
MAYVESIGLSTLSEFVVYMLRTHGKKRGDVVCVLYEFGKMGSFFLICWNSVATGRGK